MNLPRLLHFLVVIINHVKGTPVAQTEDKTPTFPLPGATEASGTMRTDVLVNNPSQFNLTGKAGESLAVDIDMKHINGSSQILGRENKTVGELTSQWNLRTPGQRIGNASLDLRETEENLNLLKQVCSQTHTRQEVESPCHLLSLPRQRRAVDPMAATDPAVLLTAFTVTLLSGPTIAGIGWLLLHINGYESIGYWITLTGILSILAAPFAAPGILLFTEASLTFLDWLLLVVLKGFIERLLDRARLIASNRFNVAGGRVAQLQEVGLTTFRTAQEAVSRPPVDHPITEYDLTSDVESRVPLQSSEDQELSGSQASYLPRFFSKNEASAESANMLETKSLVKNDSAV